MEELSNQCWNDFCESMKDAQKAFEKQCRAYDELIELEARQLILKEILETIT